MGLAVTNDVDDMVFGHRVEIPWLVGQVLVVPLQLSGIEIERDRRHGVQIVAAAHVGDPRRGVAGAEVQEIRGGIVGAGMPDGAAADLPRVGRPRLAPWLPGRGDRVPAPQAPDDHLALHDHGGLRHEVAFGVVGDLRLPYRLPRLGLEGDEIRVQGAEDHLVFRKRDAAIVRNEAHERADVLGNPPIALP